MMKYYFLIKAPLCALLSVGRESAGSLSQPFYITASRARARARARTR